MVIEWPNSRPNTPELLTPNNGATGVSRSPTLQWSCNDPDGKYDTLKYDIYFGESSSPPLKKSGHGSTSYSPESLEGETKYYWKIVAKDSKGETRESQVWSFSTEKESLSNDYSKGILDLEKYPTILTVKKLIELFDKKLSDILKNYCTILTCI